MKENKNYTAEDFELYHNGTMAPAQMHALEKAALEDPFLADALEGYVYTRAAGADIKELKERLAEKENNKAVPFSFKRSWLRIAALLIFTGLACYIIYISNNSNDPAPLADKNLPGYKTDSFAVNEKKDTASRKVDSFSTRGNGIAGGTVTYSATTFAAAEQASGIIPNGNTAVTPDAVAASPVISSPDPGQRDFYAEKETAKIFKAAPSFQNKYSFNARVIDETGAPVPFASVKNTRHNTGAVADSLGRFSIRSNDSSLLAMVSATGYEPQAFTVSQNKDQVIALKKNDETLNSVVVTALGVRRESKELGYSAVIVDAQKITQAKPVTDDKALEYKGYEELNQNNISRSRNILSGKVSGLDINSRSASADTGLVKFRNYVETNVPLVYDKNKQRLTGKVTLAYSLDSNYRPQHIRVVKSTCVVCEQEAVKLLQQAPPIRNNTNNSKNRVVIRF